MQWIAPTSKNDQRDVNAQVYPEPCWTRRVFSTAVVIRAVAVYRVVVDDATRHSSPVIHVAFLTKGRTNPDILQTSTAHYFHS